MMVHNHFDRLRRRLRGGISVTLQSEAAECGLACLVMISQFHGRQESLIELRRNLSVSAKGLSLGGLTKIASRMCLSSRPLRLELSSLRGLRLPCILHWNLNHFVVLESIEDSSYVICDPAYGRRRLGDLEVSASFTGYALELWPAPDFTKLKAEDGANFRKIVGDIRGIRTALISILVIALPLEALTLAAPLYMKWVVDSVLPAYDLDLLQILFVGFSIAIVAQVALSQLRSWYVLYLASLFTFQLKANVFSHLINLPLSYFGSRSIGDVSSRFEATEQIQRTVTAGFIEAFLDGAMSIAMLFCMYAYSPKLATMSLAAVLLYWFVRVVSYRALQIRTHDQIVHQARQTSHFLESLRGMRAIKLFNGQENRQSKWISLFVEQTNASIKSQRISQAYSGLNVLLFGVENATVIFVGTRSVLTGDLTVGVLLAFIAYKTHFRGRVSGFIDKLFEMKMLSVHADRLSDIVLTKAESVDGSLNVSAFDEQQPSLGIEVKNVCFRYGESEGDVLSGINFSVNPGECVAIVGPSGCGKSTLANILLGILVPRDGCVLIGDRDIATIGFSKLRSIVGAVLQDDQLFAGSIKDNISFFDEHFSQQLVEESARLAKIHDEIVSMPMGYETFIGEMGSVLSGGQKQRLCLARALYKRPKILLLDEATSHLDIVKEREVNDSVRKLNMTRIVIAHRPETIKAADRIVDISQLGFTLRASSGGLSAA